MIAIMLSGATAMIVSLFGTRWLIVFFRTRGQGQPILGKEDHGPDHHMLKQGTPTMGGHRHRRSPRSPAGSSRTSVRGWRSPTRR